MKTHTLIQSSIQNLEEIAVSQTLYLFLFSLFSSTTHRINTCIGIIQEGSAEKAADALKAMMSSDALVIRDGKDVKVPGDEIVPGEIVKLNLGDRVPADLRMIEVSNLSALEAALTGESVPIDKTVDVIQVEGDPSQTPLGDRHNMCFSATLVSQGSGLGLVVATGDNTEIGTIKPSSVRWKRRRRMCWNRSTRYPSTLLFSLPLPLLPPGLLPFSSLMNLVLMP